MQEDFSNTFSTPLIPAVATRKPSWIAMMVDEIEKKLPSFKAPTTGSRNFKSPKFKIPKVAYLVIAVLIIAGVVVFIFKTTKTQNAQTLSATTEKPLAPAAKSTNNLNREFSFPIKDATGKEISQIKYVVESASLQDEILVKGERARAVVGRTFLILSLKITNNYKQGIQINSRDYIRLIVDGKQDELIAADIHNDPVEVQAISTKSTRLGFPINENFKSLELQVGEINGKKVPIKIDF